MSSVVAPGPLFPLSPDLGALEGRLRGARIQAGVKLLGWKARARQPRCWPWLQPLPWELGEWELGEGQEGGSRERPAFTVTLLAASSRRRWW